jgi:hypothetical protein
LRNDAKSLGKPQRYIAAGAGAAQDQRRFLPQVGSSVGIIRTHHRKFDKDTERLLLRFHL